MDERTNRCERCGRPIAPGRARCLAHGRARSEIAFAGLSLARDQRGTRLAAASPPEEPPPHTAILPAALLVELARASAHDFEVALIDRGLRFEPGPVPRLRWRRGLGLDWLDARGFVERRVLAARFPVEVFVPRMHPVYERPEIANPLFRQLAERAAVRERDCRAYFGERWPELCRALEAAARS